MLSVMIFKNKVEKKIIKMCQNFSVLEQNTEYFISNLNAFMKQKTGNKRQSWGNFVSSSNHFNKTKYIQYFFQPLDDQQEKLCCGILGAASAKANAVQNTISNI